jgi:small-conductance mechanosensitive channel
VRFFAGLGTILIVINGLFALALNWRRWKHPLEPEPKQKKIIRQVVTWFFLIVVMLAAVMGLVAIAVPLMDMIYAD